MPLNKETKPINLRQFINVKDILVQEQCRSI